MIVSKQVSFEREQAPHAYMLPKPALPKEAWLESLEPKDFYSAAQMQAAYEAGLRARSKALSNLLFQLDKQAGNGIIPWQIEDAFAEYQLAAAKEQMK